MVSSIRQRLIASYLLLTLLTVTATGFLAVFLIQRHAQRQEQDFLMANAQAIARQSARFMTPITLHLPLQQLVQTAAFLGNAQIRILDAQENVLAASSATLTGEALAWIIDSRPSLVEADQVGTDVTFGVAIGQVANQQDVDWPVAEPVYTWTAPQMILTDSIDVLFVQKSPSIWGDRLSFEAGVLVDDPPAIRAVRAISAPLTTEVNIETRELVLHTIEDASAAGHPAMFDINVMPQEVVMPAAATLASAQVVTAPIQIGNEVLGFVELGRPPDFSAESLTAIRRGFLIAAVAAALLATGIGLGVGQGLTAPIQQLAQTAATMSAGDLSARAPVHGSDELGALARQFNQMADRLQTSFAEVASERDTLRRFIADASHELRTPITALRTFNELLQGAAADDPDAQREFLHESQEQLARLEWITRNLLDLSRLDSGLAELDYDQHAVADLLNAAAVPFRALARERNLTLEDALPATPLNFAGDGARLERAICNLLDNAIKFTPAGGTIRLGASNGNERIQIWVEDTGIGIDEDELPHIFQRFHRGRRATRSGSGLGLAIVQSVVHAHAGTVTVTSQVGSGSRFVIELPAA